MTQPVNPTQAQADALVGRLRPATLHVEVHKFGINVFGADGVLVAGLPVERIARGPVHVAEGLVELLRRLNFSVTAEVLR